MKRVKRLPGLVFKVSRYLRAGDTMANQSLEEGGNVGVAQLLGRAIWKVVVVALWKANCSNHVMECPPRAVPGKGSNKYRDLVLCTDSDGGIICWLSASKQEIESRSSRG